MTDLHGALVVGAHVVLISDTDIKRSDVTNAEGEFRFADTLSGDYRIEVSSPYFKKFLIEKIRIAGNLRFEEPIVLEVEDGVIVGELVVTGEPIACADPPKVSDEIELPKLIDLPRNTTFVLGLFPGVVEIPDEKKPAKKLKKKLPK